MTCYLKALTMDRPGSPGLRPIHSNVSHLEPDDLGALTVVAATGQGAAGRHDLGFRAAHHDWPFRQSAPLLI